MSKLSRTSGVGVGGGGPVFVGASTGVLLGNSTVGVLVGGGVQVKVKVTVGASVLVGMLMVAVGGNHQVLDGVHVGQGVTVGHGVEVGRGGAHWPGVASVPPMIGVGVAQMGGSGVIVGKRLAVAVDPITVSAGAVIVSGRVGARRSWLRSGARPSNIAPAQ